MPYVKFLSVNSKTNNSKGCKTSVNYLEKENEGKEMTNKEMFFNDESKHVSGKEVIEQIDKHKKGLMSSDAKYYEVVVSFSKDELKNKSDKELKEFLSQEFSKQYANCVKGREVDTKQLTWFAKLERERKYNGRDEAVRIGEKKNRALKEGDQRHFHILVARKTKDEKMKISPLSHHINTNKGTVKGGFERIQMMEGLEKAFDQYFKYKRPLEQTFQYRNELKKGIEPSKELDKKHNMGLSI